MPCSSQGSPGDRQRKTSSYTPSLAPIPPPRVLEEILRRLGLAAAAERSACSVLRSAVHFRGTQDNWMSANSLTRRPAFAHRSLRCSGWRFQSPLAVLTTECRVGEDPDSIDPVTAGELKTGNESFVLRFMMVPSPSDRLRYLIYITVLDGPSARLRLLPDLRPLLSRCSAVGLVPRGTTRRRLRSTHRDSGRARLPPLALASKLDAASIRARPSSAATRADEADRPWKRKSANFAA